MPKTFGNLTIAEMIAIYGITMLVFRGAWSQPVTIPQRAWALWALAGLVLGLGVARIFGGNAGAAIAIGTLGGALLVYLILAGNGVRYKDWTLTFATALLAWSVGVGLR